jgi:hypothetical protein
MAPETWRKMGFWRDEWSQANIGNRQKLQALFGRFGLDESAFRGEPGGQRCWKEWDTGDVEQIINNSVSRENRVFFLDLTENCGTIDYGSLEVTY